jgi:hypothetical protein
MSAIEEFKKLLKEAAEAKNKSESTGIEIVPKENPTTISEETIAERAARYLDRPKRNEEAPFVSESIETQRWNDPLRREPNEKFVTFKEMNDHYGLFLQRIQQQLSSIGGGGEVNFRGLDDVMTSSVGTDKFLTYNPSTRKFYFDFINPATESQLGGMIPGPGFTIETDGTLGLNAGPSFYLDEEDVFRLRPASAELIGGIKSGPGLVIDSEGTLFIDTSGLPFTFGDFTGLVGKYSSNTDYALLGSVKADEDIVLASNGTGRVAVVGEFTVHYTNGGITSSLETDPIFKVSSDGQVRILVPDTDTTAGAVEIIGSLTGTTVAPGQPGTMLHITGQVDEQARVYIDGNGNYASIVGRRWNGSITDGRTQVLANEDVLRINATAQTNTGLGGTSLAQIRFTALENQTDTAQGSKITFTVTPVGSAASDRVDVATVTVADGVSATKFTGPLTGNVTGNVSGTAGSVAAANITGTTLASNVVTSSLTTVGTLTNLTVTNTIVGSVNGNANTATTATNLAAATGILAGALNIDPAAINKNSSSTQTFTLNGLTTSHKVMIMPQAALPNSLTITAAWASATNTLSVQFQNSGGGVDPAAFNIAYFAWV